MTPESSRKNLVVLGMHRSGTSMIAGLLARCGWYVGEDDELMEAAADNPRGFYERQDVVAINQSLLQDQGRDWFNPVLCQPISRSDDIADLMASLGEHSPWLIKDPRLAITWTAWASDLENAQLVFVYRSPLAVASSLRSRHGFPLEQGLLLWEYYNRQIVSILDGKQVSCVSYDRFSEAPEQQWRKLRDALIQDSAALDGTAVSEWFESDLDHSGEAQHALARLSPQQRELAEYCDALCNGVTPGDVPKSTPELETCISEFAEALAGLAEVPALRNRLRSAESERDLARDAQRALDEQYAELTRAYQRDNEELGFLRDERLAWSAQLEERVQEIARLEDELLTLQQHLAEQDAELTELRDELSELGEQQRESQAKAEYLFHQLDQTYLKLLAFRSSLPGRMGALSSTMYKWLSLRPRSATAFDDILNEASEHAVVYGSSLPTAPAGRLRLGLSVLAYLVRHPVSSIKSFSIHRLRRALGVFLGRERGDLEVWVRQRFPDIESVAIPEVEPELDESLDELELHFAEADAPKVTIVIPVYNEYRMTLFCLRSLQEHGAKVSYEIVIADDASADLTRTIEDRVHGIRVERGDSNRGFVRNCNAGAAEARGEYLLFLNNDTAFTPGWLDELVAVLDADAAAGAVGPMLLFGNGRLQEAGGILWDDASGWNYGRAEDPQLPQFNYRRETDYVSGACLLLRTALWQQLGGFDERYVPAYYEDTDLCFAIRKLGYKVIYQPHSQVYHFEGVSHGTDLSAGVKQHQVTNQKNFKEKWQQVLAAEHFPNGQQVFHARDRSRARRTVLVVDHYVPSFDKDAGSRSTWLYLQLLVELGYNVKFIGANFFPHQPYTRALQALGVEVLVGEQMARSLDSWLAEHAASIDTVYIHRPHVAEQLLGSFEKLEPRPRLVFFGHDLHFLRVEREFEVTGNAELEQQASQWKSRELDVFRRVDTVYYPSQVEVDVIQKEAPGTSTRAIPLYVLDAVEEVDYDHDSRSDILFVGGFNHPPNVDGLCWFVDEVLPIVWEQVPELRLHVVGSNAPAVIQSLASEKVLVHGYVSDAELAALYGNARMVAVPLRFGAGVKGKVLEALQYGLPLVTTQIGAEGLPEPESVFNVEDDAALFAQALLAIEAGDERLLAKRSKYRCYLDQHFSKQRAQDILFADFGEPRIERGFG